MSKYRDFSELLVLNTVEVWTDGSACRRMGKRNTGNGGWAFVAVFEERRLERWQGFPTATNNQMELGAIYAALCILKPTLNTIRIYTDSKYSIKCLTEWHNAWKRRGWTTSLGKPVKNRELIEAILEQRKRHPFVEFKWVPGHKGVTENERADYLAGAARRQNLNNLKKPCLLPGVAEGYPFQ